MKITRKYIMDNRTDRGAWTKPQIEALGIEWPPRKGWIGKVVGKELSPDNQEIFESRIKITAKRRQDRQQATELLDLKAVADARRYL